MLIMNINRILKIDKLLKNKSFFLFGPRGTGKTTIIREQLGVNALLVNLLHSEYYLRLSARPSELEAIIAQAPKHSLVAIDEIQKVPALLDEVHRLIESNGVRFLLTGSSARKLRRGAANLLAGRAWEARLFPFIRKELASEFELNRVLRYGTLPAVYFSKMPDEELYAYTDVYLREEIQAEGVVRKIPQFHRFLKSASLTNAQVLNFTKIGGGYRNFSFNCTFLL